MDDALRRGGDDVLRARSGTPAGSTARTGSSTGAPTTRPRSPTSRSSTSRSTTRSSTRATRSPTAPARSRSRPSARRRSSPTSPSRCTPTTRATRTRSASEVVVPVVGRRVPVIADERVEPEFGSGALKITPGHDPIDFEIGRDHGLETLSVIGPDGRMTAEGFEGLDPGGGATSASSPGSKEHDQLEKRESLPPLRSRTCERCHSRIEPLVSPQWWCAMDELARAGDRGARGAPRALPPREPAPLRDRVARARRPTGASRASSGGAIRSRSGRARTATGPAPGRRPRPAPSAARASSSARPTCSTPGSPRRSGRSRRSAGPSETPELERYYPGNVNVTAREIIRLWENRMIFSGLFLLGEIPFTDVIITSTVLARRRPADVEEPRHRASTRSRRSSSTAPTRRATGC